MNTSKYLSLLLLFITFCHVRGDGEEHKRCDNGGYECGNVCTRKHSSCICGNITLTKNSLEYCCVDPGFNCTKENRYPYRSVCAEGKPTPRTQACHGICPDYSWTPKYRERKYFRSTVNTDNTTCDCPPYDWDAGWFKCGDACINKNSVCKCGNITLNFWNTQHHCCIPPGEHCISSDNNNAECTTGAALHITEPCPQTGSDEANLPPYNCQSSTYNLQICGDYCKSGGNSYFKCKCSDETLVYHDHPNYCCTSPDDHCDNNGVLDDVQTYGGYHQIICSKGTVIRKSERCNGRCYHSYDQHSTQIGSEAHYSCPDG